MKKNAILLAAIGALIISGIVSIFLVRGVFLTSPSVGVVDGISFSAKPLEVTRKLGNPSRVTNDMDRFETVEYIYNTRVFNIDTEVVFCFVDDYILTEVVGIVSLDDVDDSENLAKAWYERLYNLYKGYEGFYHDEEPFVEEGFEIRCLGTEDGAGGLTCYIENDGSMLRIIVNNMD